MMYVYEIDGTFYEDFDDAKLQAWKDVYHWYDADPVYFGGEEARDAARDRDLEEVAGWTCKGGFVAPPDRRDKNPFMIWQKLDVAIRRYPVVMSSKYF